MSEPLQSGKIVVAAPALAAELHAAAPEHTKNRIFTLPGLKSTDAFVVDLDKVKEITDLDRFEA